MHKADFAPDTDRTVLTADAADPEQGAPEHGTANDADEAEASEAGADVADEAPVEADEAEEAATVAEELDAATADRFGDTATGETDGAETGEPDDAETDEPGDTAEDAWDATGAAGDDAEGRDDAGMIASGDPNAGDGTGGGTDGPQETVCTATGAADRESDTDPQETTDGCSRVLVARTDGKGRHVADASIRVTDETGVVVADWGSGDDDHALMLADGTYTASEVATPRGAAPARDVSFAVSGGHVLGCEGNRVILTGRRSIVPIVACCVVGVAVIVAIAAFAWNRGGKNDREPLDSNVNYADNQGDITSVKSEPKIEVSEYTTFSSVSDQQWKSGSREQECVISNPAGNPVNIYPRLYINLDRSTQFAVDGNGKPKVDKEGRPQREPSFTDDECVYNPVMKGADGAIEDHGEAIAPGHEIREITLDRDIPKGTYDAQIVYTTTHVKTGEQCSTMTMGPFKVTVLEHRRRRHRYEDEEHRAYNGECDLIRHLGGGPVLQGGARSPSDDGRCLDQCPKRRYRHQRRYDDPRRRHGQCRRHDQGQRRERRLSQGPFVDPC